MVSSSGGLKKEPEQISALLEAHAIPYDMKVYPDAGHSFMNDHIKSEVPKWAVIMGKLSKSDYHESSAMDARRRITSFFTEHLAQPRPAGVPHGQRGCGVRRDPGQELTAIRSGLTPIL